ncbi:MAG: hypothetical protein ACR2JV_09005, partial [Gaiellales bacterium]
MAVHTLDVGLRGTRDYIQGSQILSRTGELVEAEADGPVHLLTAKFTRITEQGVQAAFDEADAPDGEEIGRAQYAWGGTRHTVRFFEVPGPLAPRIDDVPKVTSDLVAAADGTGACAFAIAGTFESYLVAVIEFVKAVHAHRGAAVIDIWFTALMGAQLPLAATYPTSGAMRLTPKIERVVEGRLQTLGILETDGPGAPPPFQICFSCVVGT